MEEIIASYHDEEEALDHEEQLIATLPGMTNIMLRGNAYAGLTDEQIQKKAEARREKELRKTYFTLRNWLRVSNMWERVTFPGLLDGDEKAEEFRLIVNHLVATLRDRYEVEEPTFVSEEVKNGQADGYAPWAPKGIEGQADPGERGGFEGRSGEGSEGTRSSVRGGRACASDLDLQGHKFTDGVAPGRSQGGDSIREAGIGFRRRHSPRCPR